MLYKWDSAKHCATKMKQTGDDMKHLTRRSLNTALLATTVISASAFIAPLAAHAQADA